MSRIPESSAPREWVALGEASRLLGVTPGTLRRWSKKGEITTFMTPGGHRRYRHSVIQGMIDARPSTARPKLLRSGLSQARLAREYRQAARRARSELPWLGDLTTEQRDWFRVHGRQLAEQLLDHLDRPPVDPGLIEAGLSSAKSEAGEYGQMACAMGLSLSQAVEGFLQFRRPFLYQLGVFADRRELDGATAAELVLGAERALDQLLLAVMAAYNVERVRRGMASDGAQVVDSEGIR